MESALSIAKRFREVIFNGTWIANTNFRDQLTNITWETATTKIGELNTIAALTSHIHYYIAGMKTVFEGGRLEIKDKYSFDFPPVKSKEDWEQILLQFWKDAEIFATLVEHFADDKLSDIFVDERYGSHQRNIDAMIEHSYYHLGQIVLIRKMAERKNNQTSSE